MALSTFPCSSCGADLEYAPGTTVLTCKYCGSKTDIPQIEVIVEELDFKSAVAQLDKTADHKESLTAHCNACHATVELAPNTTAQSCPFCGSRMVATGLSEKHIKPKSLLPFKIDRAAARTSFRTWLNSRWFAPNLLKRLASVEGDSNYKDTSGLAGLYIPYWTYDSRAETDYSGQRGDYYYVTVPQTVMVNGKPTTRMVSQRRTRWTSVSGHVSNRFDDVLVVATTSLAADELSALGRWDLKSLVPYQDEYLSGYRAESYTIDLAGGFGLATQIMQSEIQATIRGDIGGDQQRISSMSPKFSDITYKHILLPVWVSAYRYNGKTFRFLVNARTGEVYGKRPYSAWKIAFAVLAVLLVIAIIVLLAANK